jgi:hypothetical protein
MVNKTKPKTKKIKLNFEDQELELLRSAVDIAETKVNKKIKLSNDIDNIIKILETFLQKKKVICYGGTAINNILPENHQFYNKDVEIPDYDFYSPTAIKHSKELADIYFKNNYENVEVRSGMHKETYKVFVNFVPIADITQLDPAICKILIKNGIRKNGIYYSPPNFLRLHMYNELSRPDGDVTRWEKVYKRLLLLNKYHPFKENPKCSQINFMRDFTGNPELNNTLYDLVKDTMTDEGVVFIGGYASGLYSRYMPADQQKQLQQVPDFDVLAENAKAVAYIVKEKLEDAGFTNIKVIKKNTVNDGVIMNHYEIMIDIDTLCFIYEPYGCYSYNEIKINNKTVKIATIDTMLLFLFAFLYSARPYYDHERIMCMAQYLLNVQANNRLEQKGLLKRFNINCYGSEQTIVDLRSEKAEKYEKLKNMKESSEYKKYFFKYTPASLTNSYTSSYKSSSNKDSMSRSNKYDNKYDKYDKYKNKRTNYKNKKNINKINKTKKKSKGLFGNIW